MGTYISRGSIGSSCGKVLGKLAVGVIQSDESFARLFILVLLIGLVGKLGLDTLEAFCDVGFAALGLGKGSNTLRLSAHCALNLHYRLTGAVAAVDRLVYVAIIFDLPTGIRELFGGKLDLRQILAAETALDLLGKRNALESKLMLA